jgi:hypothetical protein
VRALIASLIGALLLAGCDGDAVDETASGEASSTPSSSSTSATRTTEASRSPTPTMTRSPEEEAQFVATVTASTFAQHAEVLSTELVKSNSLVEAQTEFRFDQPTRTVVLVVTSVFDTGSPDVPYSLATDFAPVFWGPEVASVRPESLVLFSVTVDDSSYLCDGPTMAALADRELSTEMFVQQCGT